MPIESKGNSMQWVVLRMAVVVLLASCSLGGRALAQDSGAHDRIYVVTHVDIVPPNTAAGTKLVQQYVADSRKDKGIVQIEASAQISRVNHISIVEVWQNQKAFDEHVAAAHTRQFRQQIDPMLGSPYDERLHLLLE
jgi:quinol monooxygenase YgiN